MGAHDSKSYVHVMPEPTLRLSLPMDGKDCLRARAEIAAMIRGFRVGDTSYQTKMVRSKFAKNFTLTPLPNGRTRWTFSVSLQGVRSARTMMFDHNDLVKELASQRRLSLQVGRALRQDNPGKGLETLPMPVFTLVRGAAYPVWFNEYLVEEARKGRIAVVYTPSYEQLGVITRHAAE